MGSISLSPAGPSYAKGTRVLLSNNVLRSINGLPPNMKNAMNLLRGCITEVLAPSTNPSTQSVRYKVRIWTEAAEYMATVAFGDSPPPPSIVIEVDETDIISQLTNGRNFPDVMI
ncbi:hypothetical protein FRB96_004809 [Tulasnella sp. 330]|nr:hypothetical protein FRB96_004809 [Tulasnella sp. 330]KAG8883321.1 hypothetical protein FRB98_003167 [Tulasnella sp. 332]